MIRIALLTPNWRWDDSPLAVDTLHPPASPPLEWSYLSTTLGSQLVDVIDAYALDLDLLTAVDRIQSADANIVVISTAPSILYWRCPPLSVRAPRAVTSGLRGRGFTGTILLIGPHGTHDPEFALHAVGADAVWRGSSDLRLGPALTSGDWAASPHVYVGAETPMTKVAVDQGPELPAADYTIFSTQHYAPHMWLVSDEERLSAAAFTAGALAEASRGCPWSCSYCSKAPVRDQYGRRRPDVVAKEILQAKEVGWEYLFFIDETFNLPSAAWRDLLSVLRDSGIAYGFQGRPDLIDDATARLLAESGCVYAELGIDLVGDELSKEAGRRQELAAAQRGLDACQRHIPIVRYNRLNSTTLDYLELGFGTHDSEWAEPADPIYPYPATKIGDALMRHYDRANFDWEFAERYSWWLRIEVLLQRRFPTLPESSIRGLQQNFLAADPSIGWTIATLLDGSQNDQPFLVKNKAVLGVGGRLDLGDSRI